MRSIPKLPGVRLLLAACGLVWVSWVPASAQTCATLAIRPTGWWPGEGSGQDIVGARGAVLANGATYGSGQVGQAFQFDGVDDEAGVADTPALNVGSGNFTVDFWARSNVDNNEQVMVEKWDPSVGGWTLAKRGGL